MPKHSADGGKVAVAAIECLLKEEGVDVNATDEEGTAPLHLAALNDHKDVAGLLIEHGANAHARGDYRLEWTTLAKAVDRGHHTVAKLLIGHGAEIDARFRHHFVSQWTSLHLAARSGRDKHVVELLLSCGASTEVRDSRGSTPLHVATSFRQTGVVELLVEYGAEVCSCAHDGKVMEGVKADSVKEMLASAKSMSLLV